jgi:ABC-type multidrug transport system ATPase subunit
MQKSLQNVTTNRTTVIVAHRLSTVRDADIIYVLEDGKVCEQGSHDELIAADGMYASLWRIQTGEAHRKPSSIDSLQKPSVTILPPAVNPAPPNSRGPVAKRGKVEQPPAPGAAVPSGKAGGAASKPQKRKPGKQNKKNNRNKPRK